MDTPEATEPTRPLPEEPVTQPAATTQSATQSTTTQPVTQPAPDRGVRVTHLVFGLVFLGIVGVWALDATDVVDWTASRYLGPAVLVGAGLIGLVVMLATAHGRRGTGPEEGR